MRAAISTGRLSLALLLSVLPSLLYGQAGAQPAPPPTQNSTSHEPANSDAQSVGAEAELPVNFERHTGDLDEMVKRGSIRALVIYSRTGFFYVNGRPAGINYEALSAFQQFVNRRLRGRQHIEVTFIPMRPDEIQAALTQGVGDLIAYGLVETPKRAQEVSFSVPIQTDVKQIVVGGKDFGAVTSLDDLSGKKIYVNPLATYRQNLEKVNATLRSHGKPPIGIEPADQNLMDEDLMEMVNAGLLPATVTLSERADLWSQVLGNLHPYPNVPIGTNEDLAWAMRKNNPQLTQLVNQFAETHAAGTSFGNTLIREYLQQGKELKDATSPSEIKKFEALVAFFKKYSSQYNFDYLMIVAQGYQESMLEQSARSPGGAVGIMQVMPSTAAAPPISIPDILTAENNIHAGVKILRGIADRYFNDPAIDPTDRLLFTFAGYNAGPNRIADLRRRAAAQGLNPNKWFGNVELLVDQNVGPVTVEYVSNIYKYYVAYRLVVQEQGSLQGSTN